MDLISTALMSSPFTSNNPEFEHLRRLQQSMGNITTYANGGLSIVEYPANTDGGPVSPADVWIMLITHKLPRLFCFHGREAWVRMPGPFNPGMALCRSEDDFCGYMIDFFQIACHPNLRTKVYHYRESAVRVAVETTPDRLEPEDDRVVDFALDAMTESSPAPSTAATCLSTPGPEIGPSDSPNTPPPAYSTPPSSQTIHHTAGTLPEVQEERDQDIQQVFAILQTPGGVAKGRFWQIFRQCSFCPFIVMKHRHHKCLPVIDLTENDESMPDIIDLTGDD